LFISDAEVEEPETRLAKEWDSDEAVDWSCDCMLLELLSTDLELPSVSDLGLASVLRRRSTPDTAYEIGYVKYEDERVGVDCEDGGEDDAEECGVSEVVGMAQCL
jgi:hypothetical protein